MNKTITLEEACKRATTGLVVRYGNALFTRMHGKHEDFSRSIATVFSRAGISAETVSDLSSWLQQGLRPFSDYPPNIEILMHLCYLIRSYPITDYQKNMREAWYSLDTSYGQMYSKSWKGEKALDELLRERVWLTEFEKIEATEDDIRNVVCAFQESGLFRQFAPSLEQFMDAFLSVRKGAPIVEVAWLESSDQITTETHPMVIRARSAVGSHDLNVQRRDKDMRNRFEIAYKKVLTGEIKPELKVIVDNDRSREKDYVSASDLAEKMKNW